MHQGREKGLGDIKDTSYAARILRERRVSELEFEDLTYSKAPPLAIPGEYMRDISTLDNL